MNLFDRTNEWMCLKTRVQLNCYFYSSKDLNKGFLTVYTSGREEEALDLNRAW